jgi:hypothetical protein
MIIRFIKDNWPPLLMLGVLLGLIILGMSEIVERQREIAAIRHTVIQYSAQGDILNKWEHAYVRYESRGRVSFVVDNVEYSIHGPYMTKRE